MKNSKLLLIWFLTFIVTFSCAKKKEEYGDSESDGSVSSIDNNSDDNSKPGVLYTYPDGVSEPQSITAEIVVGFTQQMIPSSISTTICADSESSCTCQNKVHVSKDSFSSCIPMTSESAVDIQDSKIFTFIPKDNLSYGEHYKIRVKSNVRSLVGGENLAADYTSIGFITKGLPDNDAPYVKSTSPENGQQGVPTNTNISIEFNEAMDTSTVTTNTSSTSCRQEDSIQLSKDNFDNCVKMTVSSPLASNGNTTFQVTPFEDLDANTAYTIKVKNHVTDASDNKNHLFSHYSNSFTTGGAQDTTRPYVSALSPTNGEDNVSISTPIVITFSEPMDVSSITTNTSDTSCTGSFQLSLDNFNNCVQMTTTPSSNDNNTTFTLIPSALGADKTYKIRVTSAVKDSSNNSMLIDNTTPEGFSTRYIFRPSKPADLQTAVDLWVSNKPSALATYGEINNWDVSLITDMESLFFEKENFNDNISNWDVSNVTNMKKLFNEAASFNQDISRWDVSNVTTMEEMFKEAVAFDNNLSVWDVSSVTNMRGMFQANTSFNQDISGWNVSNVTDMGLMFYNASKFNQNISDWDVSSVISMALMFAISQDNNFDNFNKDISGWDVSSVTTMYGMFAFNSKFNQDISGWDVSSVTDMNYMFMYASKFNQNISSWDISNVNGMDYMFYDNSFSEANKCLIHTAFKSYSIWPYDWSQFCDFIPQSKFELETAVSLWISNKSSALENYGDISTWDVSQITDMSDLFKDKSTFNDNISNWDVSNVTNMSQMFRYAGSFNQNISGWDVSNVTNMHKMFRNATSFNSDISSWNVSSVTDMTAMFQSAKSFNQNISGWVVSNVTKMHYMFADAQKFNGNISTWNVTSVTDMKYMLIAASDFNQNISSWNVSSVTDMYRMFMGASSFNQNISSWNVSNVANMSDMFLNSSSLSDTNKGLIHVSFKTNSNWQYDWSGFAPQTTFKPQSKTELQTAVDLWVSNKSSAISSYGEINTWDVSLITSMSELFYNKTSFNDNISNWDVSNVTNMYKTFDGATIFNGDIRSWDVSNVTNFYKLFHNGKSFNQDISNWDLSGANSTTSMFLGATSFNQDISGWNLSSVTQTHYMFNGATSFNRDISGWDVSNVTDMTDMFDGAEALSDTNKCFIHSSFQSNDAWPYDWSAGCEEKWTQQAYIKAVNNDANDSFGLYKATIDGDTIAVGAPWEDSNQVTITNGTSASSNNSNYRAGAAYVYKRTGNTWAQEAFIKAVNNISYIQMNFGYGGAVISGDTLAVTAMYDASNQTTITNWSTASTNTDLITSGAAFVYKRTGNTWVQQAYIKASNADRDDRFGSGIALDGDTLAVYASKEDSNQTTINNSASASSNNSNFESGAVYIYKRTGTSWAQEAYIKAANNQSGDKFGYPVLDNNTLAVGVRYEDSNQKTITMGSTASSNNSSSNSGAVYVYKRTGTTWAQEAYIKAANADSNDYFGGFSTSHAMEGDLLAVGAYGEDSNQNSITNTASSNNSNTDSGAVYVYKRGGANSVVVNQAGGEDWNGTYDFVGTDCGWRGNGCKNNYQKGNYHIFRNEGGYWYLDKQNVGTEYRVAFNDDSDTPPTTGWQVVGNGQAPAPTLTVNTSGWTQEAYIKPSNSGAGDSFGVSVSISGNLMAVGATGEDSNQSTITNGSTASSNNDLSNSGAVYIFERTDSGWVQKAYIKPPNPDVNDYFGRSVSLNGKTLLVTSRDDSNQTTITNGTTASDDNSNADSGAAYVFVLE